MKNIKITYTRLDDGTGACEFRVPLEVEDGDKDGYDAHLMFYIGYMWPYSANTICAIKTCAVAFDERP